MKKSIISVMLAILLVFINACVTLGAEQAPHYYATALQDFLDKAVGKTAAVMIDLDGDGVDEIIALDEGVPTSEWAGSYTEGAKIAFYGLESGKYVSSGINDDGLISNVANVYISNKNFIVIEDSYEGYWYNIYEFKNGTVACVAAGGKEYDYDYDDYYFLVNGAECTESQYNSFLDKYGVDSVSVGIRYGVFQEYALENGWPVPRDDTQRILALTQTSTTAIAQPTIKVTLNGTELQFDQPPMVLEGRTLVPLRAIFEALGSTVVWNGDTQTVIAQKDDITISLTIGSNILVKNGENIKLDVPAQLVNGRTLVPARAVAESFGAKVDWDEKTQTVILNN
jgi:hypothetical protein